MGRIYKYCTISVHLKSGLIRGMIFGGSGLIREGDYCIMLNEFCECLDHECSLLYV